MTKIAHIINPVITDSSSDLFKAQTITFKTIKAAYEFAKGKVEVCLYAAFYPEDKNIVPDFCQPTPLLEHSVLDINVFKNERKLPLIKDILDRLYAESHAEYFLYTNVDIALQPHFYTAINKIINNGYDAFTVNRRTISKDLEEKQLSEMYKEKGESHPGHDCFVFKRSLYPKLDFSTVCIGADWIGRTVLTNLVCHSVKFKIFENEYLTFHLGDDRVWKNPVYNDYSKHNQKELHKILLSYKSSGLLAGHPLPEKYLHKIENPSPQKRNSLSSLKKFFLKKLT